MAGPVNGTGDTFPSGECTYYASKRYHDLANFYVPWSGDAYQWAGNASKYGWTNSSKPSVPSIICLQPGVQLADTQFGHVGVVESINANNSVHASNLNWGDTAAKRSITSYVDFHTGSGVSFITAGSGGSSNGVVDIDLRTFVTSVVTQLRNNAGQTNAIGQGPSQNIINFMISWAHHEGGSQTNACKFNVLNTMQDETGAVQCPGTLPGIKSYPDSATGEKGQVDALQNGFYKSLLNALVTNDEINLGFSKRDNNTHSMASNVAGDLSVWLSGKRSPIAQDYILAIMTGAGISNASVEGGNKEGGTGSSQQTIDSWGSKVIGTGVVTDNNPLNQLADAFQGLAGLNTFFSNLNSLFADPMRIIKIVGGSTLVIAGLVLLVKQFVPNVKVGI